MITRTVPRDLFGKPIRQHRPRYEAALERADRASLGERAARVRWVAKMIPRNILMAMPFETAAVFQEAKSTFIAGHFVATVVLAAAFIEHWFSSNLISLGFGREAAKGLAASISCSRKHNLVPSVILEKADRLRQIRNPFVHLKSFEHEHNLTRRAFKIEKLPHELLETDAQESLSLIYAVGIYAFKRT